MSREFRVFYSWQSDLPNATNRGFIERALEDAAEAISADASIEVEPVIDRDTAGVPGIPDIARTIFEKIDKSDVFACDVTIVNAGQKDRPTPNPNVLVELGYALRSLGPERIIMVMNTAFGKPESLPFDLKMKRVATYQSNPQDEDKAGGRKRLAGILEDALTAVISRVDEAREETIPSGNKAALKEECETVLRHGDLQEWRDLVAVLMTDVPERLLEWMKRTGQMWGKATEGQKETARFEAVEICLPSFVPIFVAAEKGQKDFWRESVGSLRELALLRDRMGGGFTEVLEIGSHMLYIAGSIGIGIAARSKQLPLINDWMRLPMPITHHGEPEEASWLLVRDAHHLWGGYIPANSAPFGAVLRACKSEYLSGFIRNHEKFPESLCMGNLVQSLHEMAWWVQDADRARTLESARQNELVHNLNIWPLWGLMEPNEFRRHTWALFGSADGVRRFAFPGNGAPFDTLWLWWKRWKEVCINALMQLELTTSAPRMLHAQWLTLPGEPAGERT